VQSHSTAPTDGDRSDERAPSPAVDRALRILEALVATEDELTLTAIAARTDVPLATCGSIMRTLELRGFAVRRIVGRSHLWRPTLRLYALGARLMSGLDLPTISQPQLRRLADELGVPCHVGVLDGSSVVYVAKAATTSFVQFNTYTGKALPFNLTALGKAIAAFLDAEELAPLLSDLKPGKGPKGKSADRQLFLDELARVRVDGYALEDEEDDEEIACVAAPIFGAQRKVIASLGATGFARDVAGARLGDVAEAVQAAAAAVSQELGHVAAHA
jgi:DNA-binding IclR family transcriptional regulator